MDDSSPGFFLSQQVSRELDAIVSLEMFLAQGAGEVKRLSPDTGVALLEAVLLCPIQLPKLRARLIDALPQWVPHLTHASLGKAALALSTIDKPNELPSVDAAVPAAKSASARRS